MNKLEEAMSKMSCIQDNIDTIAYAIGDAPRQYTEDELLNMLIGMSQFHKTWYDNLWMEYQNFKREHNVFDKDDIFDQNYMKQDQETTPQS
jgi:hypothetical protein